MIVSIGEILADVIMDADTGEMRAYVGGAPFNVAVNAFQCGGSVAFYGRVGDDPIGNFLKKKVYEKLPKDRFFIQTDDVRPTTLAIVSLTDDGERDFRFIRENAADYHIDPTAIMATKRDIFHIGSLMLGEKEGRKLARDLVTRADAAGAAVAFDVNYRADIFKNGTDAVFCYLPLIERADVVKFSEEEVAFLYGKSAEEKIKEWENPIVCVTLGKRGCLVKVNGEVRFVPTTPVTPVDTTGAGDAFFGAFLAGIDGLGKSVCDLTIEDVIPITRRANEKGGEATQHKGAVVL